MSIIKIALVDNQPIFCKSLETYLNTQADFKVIMLAFSGRDILKQLETRETVPDIVLLDLEMPNLNGTETLPILKERYSQIKVIILSFHSELNVVRSLIEIGASGYVCKAGNSQDIFTTIRQVHKTGFYLSNEVKMELRNAIPSDNGLAVMKRCSNKLLSDKEKSIIKHICKGESNKQIAELMNTSVKSIEYHKSNLFKKTKSRNVAALVHYAIENMLDI